MTAQRSKDLTEKLQVSASTLRLWSENFGPVLSPAAQKATTETGGAAALQRAGPRHPHAGEQLLACGKAYEEAFALLQAEPPDASPEPPTEPVMALQTMANAHPLI